MAASLSAGDKLHALFTDGQYYPAEVLTVETGKKRAKAPVKVAYTGYPGADAWLPLESLQSKKIPKTSAAKTAPAKANDFDYSGLQKGMRVQVELQGIWYAADVVTVATAKAKAKAPVKVHFAGYSDDTDEWVGGDRIRSKAISGSKAAAPEPSKKASVGAPVAKSYDYSGLEKGISIQAELQGVWYTAEVVTVATGKGKAQAPVKVHFTGYGKDSDEWVGGDRIRSKALRSTAAANASGGKATAPEPSRGKYDFSGLEKGMRVQAEMQGTWYAAEVVTVAKGKDKAKAPVKVHFAGYGADSDEWVGGDRLRSKALKALGDSGKAAASSGKTKSPEPSKDKYDYSGLEKGMRLQVEMQGTWYAAEVVTVAKAKAKAKAPVKVHYVGYGDDTDEWVGGDRLRSKALKSK